MRQPLTGRLTKKQEWDREYRRRNRDKVKAKQLEWYERNKEAQLEAKRQYYQENKDKWKSRAEVTKTLPHVKEYRFRAMIRHHYGEEAARTVSYPKPTACEICGRTSKDPRGLHFEHCHKTGKFRGWACDSCNHAIAKCDDNPAILRQIADYLERHINNVL